MKKVIFWFLVLSMMSLTSCIDMLEELYLNKDGSGTYSLTFDMSGLFKDPMMKGLMEEMMQGEGEFALGGADFSENMDTMVRFSDMPQEQLAKMEKPEFWKKVSMRIVMSEEQKAFKSELKLDFTSVDDIDYFYKNLDKLGDEKSGAIGGGMANFLPTTGLFKLKKRNFTRMPSPKIDNELSDDEMGMAKMFFSAASYKTVYHFPGKVKKATMPGAEIDGKTVTINNSFLDLMEGKAKMEGEIRFKKR